MTDSYHPLTTQIQKLLDENGCWYETFEHKPVRTSKEAADIRDGYTLEQGAKALIIRVKLSKNNKFFVMLVLPGDKKFDSKKVNEYFEAKDIRFTTAQEVSEITDGVQPGGVPPFGNLFGLRVVVDPSLFEHEKIVFNAGDKSFSIGMKASEYKKVVPVEAVSIV